MLIRVNRLILSIIAGFVLVSATMFETAGHPILSTEPTAENALAADQELARALQNNDTLGIVRMLDKDWAVITSFGDIAEGSDAYTSGIRSGQRILTALELSEPRVRLFGHVAVVTSKSRLAIVYRGKPMEFYLCQTDTWLWKNGAWICILTQESGPKKIGPTGPTVENALAADQELARALRDNDTAGILRMLDKEWAVISAKGGVGEGPSIFPDGVKSGYLTRKTLELSEPRVRLYGNIALVTTKVKTSGMFKGKPFDVKERQTDVLRWEDGGWKCILTHETMLAE